MFNASNKQTNINGEITDYICFGRGEKNLVIIPGVGDGLKTVKGMALPFAFLYRKLAKQFKVYVFSRPVNLKPNTSTEEMAESLYKSINSIGILKASIVGVSQGGMIAQHLAINHPDVVEKLVLTVTSSRPNPTITSVINTWIEMANKKDYKSIMLSFADLSYTAQKSKKSKILYNLLGSIGKPKSFNRFLIQAKSCVTHNTYSKLNKINCPTLIIGGSDDKIVTCNASKEMAEKIRGSNLVIYDGLGHGLYEEAKDFLSKINEFCKR